MVVEGLETTNFWLAVIAIVSVIQIFVLVAGAVVFLSPLCEDHEGSERTRGALLDAAEHVEHACKQDSSTRRRIWPSASRTPNPPSGTDQARG